MDLYTEIKNSKLLLEYFGSWPSFNDCEIIEIRLNRELGEDFLGPTVYIEFYIYDQNNLSEVQSSVGDKAVFGFYKIDDLEIRDFNHQNQFNDFNISKFFSDRLKSDRYSVELEGFGASVKFSCALIEVLSIEKHKPKNYFKQFEE